MKKRTPQEAISAAKAAERAKVTVRWISELCKLGDEGPFPNAYKLDPEKKTSVWLIPLDEFEPYEQKRARQSKAD